MARFESLKHVPAETRIVLRERFARNLQVYTQARAPTQAERVFDDELVLKLFQHLTVIRNDVPERAKALYDDARRMAPDAPTMDELIADGWVATGWRCLGVIRDVRRSGRQEEDERLAPFAAWCNALYESTYRMGLVSGADGEFAELAESITSGARPPMHITCRTPVWVAARVWDRDERHHSGAPDFLFDWLQVWEMLNYPQLVPSAVWGQDACKHFEMAALAVLEYDARPLSWSEYRQRGVLQLARARGGDNNQFDSYLPPLPSTLVARAVWLTDNRMEFLRYDNGAWRHAAGLVTLLLTEVEHCEHARAPHPAASRVLDLALKHPEVLSSVLFCVEQRSILLADFALKPETSALACLLISKWRLAFGAWDRQLTVRDNEAARNEAFVDALSVMCHHVKSGKLPPDEVAALLYELHARAEQIDGNAALTRSVMLAALRSELAGFSRSFLVSMFDALVRNYEAEVGLPAFTAALDLIEVGQLVSDIDCSRLIRAYVESIRKQDYGLSTMRISPDGAAALFEMAERIGGQIQQEFLSPIDVGQRLSSALDSDENEYTAKQNLARALRVHMSILARAVTGQRAGVPPSLVTALAEAIYSGAVTNSDKGRITAFAARYDRPPTGPAREPGLAADIGSALVCASEADGHRLLAEILEIDEPAFLAQLCGFVPATMQSKIRERIRQLVPGKADDAWYVTDLHFRIDELISIGEYSVAETYITSLPEPPKQLAGQFAVVRLRQRLQLALATKDWGSLENPGIPPDLRQGDEDTARDTIRFYCAVAQLTKDDGDVEGAERAFEELHRRHQGIPEYGYNWFAAKLGRLIGNQPFVRLRGRDLARARELFVEAERMEAAYDLATPSADSYLGNKALLLLVLDRPREAADVLRGIFLRRMTDRVGAYLSVALARLGRVPDALATLDVAEESLGRSELLEMARAHITDGRPVPRLPLLLSEPDNSLVRVKEALLLMHQMDPVQQAELWSIPPDAFLTFVTEQVRHAAASIVALVPMMKGVTLDSCEDDVNTVVRELLASRLSFLNWTVHDQSRRGYSGNENFGELDLLIQKGTSDLAAIEAVVCKYSAVAQTTEKELLFHFQKLLGYSTCKLFFHLTYSRVSDIASIVSLLRNIARRSAPPNFEYREMSDFSPTDSRPTGFRAMYRTQDGDAYVVFLVLNLAQDDQRGAAKMAAANSPRASKMREAGSASARRTSRRTRVSK